MARPVRLLSLFVVLFLLVVGAAFASESCRIQSLEEKFVPAPLNLPAPKLPADPVLEAIELELASRLVGVAPGEAHRVAGVLVTEARKAGFDPWYIIAIIEVESAYDADACSSAGARGLMQLMPATFHSVSTHYRVSDPVENVRAGIAYLSKLYAAGFRWPETILLAYNGGPANATAYAKAIRAKDDLTGFPREMKEYPHLVLKRYLRLRSAAGDAKPSYKTWRTP
jgi:soluble lytic murein transglycosylase-like protein